MPTPLYPEDVRIPAQRAQIVEGNTSKDPTIFTTREWYRFFGLLQKYLPLSASFTPAPTAGANVTTLTARQCIYTQSGNVVQVTGQVLVAATAASVLTTFTMPLPVTSNITETGQASGMATASPPELAPSGAITANVATKTLLFELLPATTSLTTYVFTANYQIV